MKENLVDAIVGMKEEDSTRIVEDLLKSGTDPMDILNMAREAMEIIGQKYADGVYFIPELVMGGEIMNHIVDMVKPLISEKEVAKGTKKLGKVVIGTVKGDIHDIGKNLVVFFLETSGFDVIDLGVDVDPSRFVEAVKKNNAPVVGLSGFLTLSFDSMKLTVDALVKEGIRDSVKVMIGGGQVDDRIREYTKADAYGDSADEAVKIAKKWIGG